MNLNIQFDENQKQLGQKKAIAPRLPLHTSNTSNNNITNIPIASRNLGSFSKKSIHPVQKTIRKQKMSAMISIDFWENYDPAEVSQTGFGLIVTESIPMRALCFLCGSTGVDPMIFCACCCEPYHQYCVEDEYNLKHSSLDETMLSLLDTSLNPVENLNLITNRLNWLCPRCTVCYTCNMSSGSKVKCQKCQKNYHTTCLGTSKRLLGADRPLICVNCLKCKSCSTTKVSKFVGNLPMCSQCFKLRKKGNFCPICQKCYEENDFDLKMMECGDCQRWVHSRCEGLTDEQYNLLSTLPESIEFICRKCSKLSELSKERATEWRDAVSSEFKSGLLSVVKLLSKSRQACALLKLSPRKKTTLNCVCQSLSNGAVSRSLNFNKLETQTNSDGESQDSDDISMEDVYEFKDTNKSSQINDCYCTSKQSSTQFVPDSDALSLVDIKRKVNASEYISLSEFNYDMNNVILAANCDDLIITYKEILSEQFPWFQNETKACTDALEEDMFDSCGYSQSVENVDNDQQVPVIDLPNDIDDCLYSPNFNEDTRICMFCKKCGESESSQESRLIYCGQNSWVHINCAMWSAEVFEEIDGSLQNVHSAISRGRMIKCTVCNNRGATIGCNVKSCGEHYHFSCAKRINCAFMTDKTVFCPEHLPEVDKMKFTLEKNFEVLRPVYVELDRKRKKLVDPINVKFLIGSLEIKKLGRIFPKFSDTNEAIVPIDFHCTRLYWSTKEPWKIVEYTVTTSIQNNLRQYSNDLGRNFTVDHSNNLNLVQLGLAQISRWHSSLLLDDDMDMSSTFYRQSNSLKQLIESSGHIANTEDGNDEEPQNNADLLPPEIKDAIFEDLPHEILDGISMLDIFPKLMIYEDMITMDSKTENYFLNDHSKDNTGNNSDGDCEDEECNQKELEFGSTWSSNTLVNHVEDAMLSAVRPLGSGAGREIKRSKSELISRSVGGNRSQQRSSSLTWGCKFDNNAIKRRKITKGLLPESVLFSLGHRKLDFPPRGFSQQIDDGNVNTKTKTFLWSVTKKSQESDGIHLKDEKLKISQLDGMDDSILESVSSYQHQLFSNSDGPVKCIRCQCTYRSSESFQRHLATCEAFSTSESESETAPRSPDAQSPNNNQSHLLDSNKTQHHHQNIQQQPISFIQNLGQSMPMTSIQNNLISHSNGLPITTFNGGTLPLNNVQIQNLQSNGIPMSQFNQGIQNIFVNNTTTQQQQQQQSQQQFYPVSLQSLNTTNMNNVSFSSSSSSSVCNPTISFSTSGIQQQQIQQPQVFTMSTADGNQQVVTITPNGQQQQTIRTSTNQIYQQHGQQILRTNFETSKQSPTKLSKYSKLSQSAKTKQKIGSSVRPIQMKKKAPNIVHHQQQSSVQILNQNQIPQQQQQQNSFILQQSTNGGQPIILQQIGGNQTTTTQANVPQNLLSYVTDNGQNQLQYVTLPNTGDYKPQQQQFLTTTNQLVQGAYLQADASGNLVLTNGTPGGLQMLSAAPLQLQSAQPQVIGTLIQPQTLQLGGSVMSTDQMMLGGTPTLEMLGNQMILANQPVYYGLETIVQNTVMQSQQFVSTAMQGVLSQNASFSATTTQVFQASKIEPIVDVPTAGYVVLNNVDGSATIVQQPASHPNLLSANVLQQPTLTQIQSQHIHNPQPQQQINNQPIYSIQTPQQTVTHSAIIHPNQIQHNSANHVQQPTIINTPMGSSAQTSIQSNPSVVNQNHHRSISPSKPVAKSAPIVMTKIQPQVVNKVVPTLASGILLQEHKQTNQFRSSKTVTIAPATNVPNSEAFIVNPNSASNNTSSVKAVKSTNSISQQIIKPKISNYQSSLPVNSVQRKTNMIKPLNKVSSISIKPKSKTAKTILNSKISENNALKLSMVQQQSTSNAFEVKQQVSANAMQHALKAIENPVSFVESNVLNNACKLKQIDQIKIKQSKDLSEEVKTNDTNTTITKSNDFIKLKEEIVSNDESNKNIVANVQDFSESKAVLSNEVKELTTMYTQNLQQPPLSNQQFQFTISSSSSKPIQNSPPVTVTTSSIQLPSAPFVVSSFNNILNGNVPTNIVNPIQQNQSSPIVSRPTNRVLPMQSVQLKQQLASPKQTNSISKSNLMNPEKSLNINKHIRDIVGPINSPTFESKERNGIEDIQSNSIANQIDDTRTDEAICKSDCESIITDIEQFNEDTTQVTIPIDSGKDFKPEDENENFKLDFNEVVNANDDFNMKEVDDEIPSLPGCDNLSDSTTTTPEVQEKICEILENLENEECDKNSLLIPDNFNAENISPVLNKVENANQKENNMNPINKNSSECAFKLCPIKSEDEKCNDQFKPSGPKLLYEIQSEDGFTYKSTSIADVWEKVFEAVQVARKAHGLLPLPEGPLADMSGIQMLGLKTNALRYLIEQLPGVERCTKYTPKYHKQQQMLPCSSGYTSDQEDLKENPYSAARLQPYTSRSEYDMFSWLASRHRRQPIQIFLQPSDNELIPRRGTGSNLPMAMKYRTLKETYKDYVGVFRSHIHGRGLYCKKDIEAGEMVIEYAGELIRSTLTDKRERYYDSKGIGCYMFKIDENLVVDATMRGNAARFINHACEPNCYSKVVDILGHKHIIIFALRRIVQGEELTYDYKFPFEEIKIPCSCGSKKCRKYLN